MFKTILHILGMQRKIDAYEEVMSRITSYIFIPQAINEDTTAGLTREIPDAKHTFRFLLWIKKNQPDIFERFLKDEF